jgi:hypothetical protein
MANQASVELELVQLEKQYWQALKDRDVDTMLRLTDFPCLIAGAQGVDRIDEKTFATMMKDTRYSLDDFDLAEDIKVRVLGDDVAVVAYKAHEELTVDGEPVELDVTESSTWIRRNGKWVCAQHTEAIVGDPFGRDRITA